MFRQQSAVPAQSPMVPPEGAPQTGDAGRGQRDNDLFRRHVALHCLKALGIVAPEEGFGQRFFPGQGPSPESGQGLGGRIFNLNKFINRIFGSCKQPLECGPRGNAPVGSAKSCRVRGRGSVVECGSPLPRCDLRTKARPYAPGAEAKAPEGWRTPKASPRRGACAGSVRMGPGAEGGMGKPNVPNSSVLTNA